MATLVVRLTTASETPGADSKALVMALEHIVHVMPPMTISKVRSCWEIGGGSRVEDLGVVSTEK